MSLTIHQTDVITAQAVDAANNPVSLPAGVVPVWTVADPTFGTLATAADGLSSVFTPAGPVGSVTIGASATLPDNSVISGKTSLDITGGVPVALTLTAAAPTP